MKDRAIGSPHRLIGDIQRLLPDMKGVGIFHDELATADQAEARADLITELGLDLIEIDRKLPVGRDGVPDGVRDDLLMRRSEEEVTLVAVLDPQELLPVLLPPARLHPQL